jgi:hypothetical protein
VIAERSPLARRIDRLSRRAHAFHRFAHHPLCGEYAGEVLRIGRRTRLCRGCSLAAAGAALGAIAGFSVSSSLPALSAVLLALLLTAARARTAGKLATRFLPAGLLAFAIVAGARSPNLWGLGLLLLALGAGLLAVARYRRRGPDRTPCASCPERTRAEPCRGFAPIVRRERAFGRLAGSWIRAEPSLSPPRSS